MSDVHDGSGMTTAQRQEFFEREGYWPLIEVARYVSKKEAAEMAAKRLQDGLRSRFLRGWKTPLHWRVPPTFAEPGKVYEDLCYTLGQAEGHAEFCRQVEAYYGNIMQQGVEHARREHVKWAIKQVLRTFETQRRGFRRQEVTAASRYRRGGVFTTASDVPTSARKLADPEQGRLMGELHEVLRAYGLGDEDAQVAAFAIRQNVASIYNL